jgi:hypothetical protein
MLLKEIKTIKVPIIQEQKLALQRWAVDNGYSTSGIKSIAYGKWKRYKNLVSVEEVAQAPTQKALDAL